MSRILYCEVMLWVRTGELDWSRRVGLGSRLHCSLRMLDSTLDRAATVVSGRTRAVGYTV